MSTHKKQKRRLRLIWSSNAPWSKSGYANQTRDLVTRFVKDGWNVAISCFFGLEGGIIDWNGIRCYPKLGDTWGVDAMIAHSEHFKADITISFQDSWVLNQELLNKIPRYVPYIPIDHDPVPPAILERVRPAYRIITYSEFGQQQLWNNGYNSTLIPHGVDTNIFKKMDRKETRKKYGIPGDIFLFGMVSANKDNPPRKEFQRVMDAFKRFQVNHPKSGIFFHTIVEHNAGFPIISYATNIGIGTKIFFMKPYQTMMELEQKDIAGLFNCFDVLLCPSSNEGFGLPIIEAQSCEVPVITNNFTSMPELIRPGITGYATKPGYKRYTPLLSFIASPDEEDLYNLMEKLFTDDREKMGKAGRQYMIEKYDIDKLVKDKWNPLFEEIEKDIYT